MPIYNNSLGMRISIGKMAKINHISTSMLRYYDSIGLISPAIRDPHSGYRYYLYNQNYEIRMILSLKHLGLSIETITKIFKSGEPMLMQDCIGQRLSAVENDIQALKSKRRTLLRYINTLNQFSTFSMTTLKQIAHIKYMEKQRILIAETESEIYEKTADGEYNLDIFLESRSRLELELLESGVEVPFYLNSGCIIKQEHIETNILKSNQLFLYFDDDVPPLGELKVLNPGFYACIYTNSYLEEEKAIETLLSFIKNNNYEIIGDCYVEPLIDNRSLDYRREHKNMELIRIPVRLP